MRKSMSQQGDALAVVLLALLAVLLYTLWGASVLHTQSEAATGSGAAVVVKR